MPDHVTAFAPGRVNLIGEHTDYNGGLALPFAIDTGVTVEARVIPGDRIEAYAADLDARDGFPARRPTPADGWRAFVRGAVGELAAAGVPVGGLGLRIEGNVPRGSGLSSSAALEVALCLALIECSEASSPSRLALAQICSRIENEWAGANTGLLDQLASLYGERDSALLIDFRSLDVRPVPLRLHDYRLVTLDSGEQHANADSGYNERRAECARAGEMLELDSLREATPEMARGLPDPLSRRVTHVITENARVQDAVEALQHGDLSALGSLLDASHASLRDDYEVSTPAVEAAIDRLREAGAVGARIMGGGFGGHVLGLLAPDAPVPEDATEVRPGPGARVLAG